MAKRKMAKDIDSAIASGELKNVKLCEKCGNYHRTDYDCEKVSIAAATLGHMTSDKKAAAARVNGKRGGRPRKETTMTDNNTHEINENEYKVWASNDQGASTDVANNKPFTSQRAAEDAARNEMGRGWTIHVMRNGDEIKRFRIR